MRILAALLLCLIALPAFAQSINERPINELPMYGGFPKTAAMRAADEQFIASVLGAGYTRETGARAAIQSGWREFGERNAGAAMRRFNQAWLLDPENGDVFHGFALVLAVTGAPEPEVEKFFEMAISKPRVGPNAHSDYARFLNQLGRFDAAIARGRAALAVHPRAPNARLQIAYGHANKNEFADACRWAREAAANGDDVDPPNFPDMMCAAAAR